ncbi:MAG TPA: hypothetical protein VF399_02005 [bacterium]
MRKLIFSCSLFIAVLSYGQKANVESASSQSKGLIGISMRYGPLHLEDPSSIDPWNLTDNKTMLPEVEIEIYPIEHVPVTISLSRISTIGSLGGPTTCPQFLELKNVSLGTGYDIPVWIFSFKPGIDVMYSFGEYSFNHSPTDVYSSSGWGVDLHVIERIWITKHFSIGMKQSTSLLSVAVRPLADNVNLDSHIFQLGIGCFF